MDRCGVFNSAEMSRFRHVRASALLISHRTWHCYRYREQNAKSISLVETETKFPRSRTLQTHTLNVVVKNCRDNPREIFAMEFDSFDFEEPSTEKEGGAGGPRRRSTFEYVYEIFNGLCECLWFSFLPRICRRRVDIYNFQRRMLHAARYTWFEYKHM